jgi:hypothetical protein
MRCTTIICPDYRAMGEVYPTPDLAARPTSGAPMPTPPADTRCSWGSFDICPGVAGLDRQRLTKLDTRFSDRDYMMRWLGVLAIVLANTPMLLGAQCPAWVLWEERVVYGPTEGGSGSGSTTWSVRSAHESKFVCEKGAAKSTSDVILKFLRNGKFDVGRVASFERSDPSRLICVAVAHQKCLSACTRRPSEYHPFFATLPYIRTALH